MKNQDNEQNSTAAPGQALPTANRRFQTLAISIIGIIAFIVGATSASTAVDTSGWKTYKNDQYGFVFQYPGDWPIKDSLQNNRVDSTITVGDSAGADNPINYPKCYLVYNFQFSNDSIIPGPHKYNYYNQMSEGEVCENTLKQIISTFKFTK